MKKSNIYIVVTVYMHTTVVQERMNGSNNIYKSKRGGASGYFEKCSSELTSICLA